MAVVKAFSSVNLITGSFISNDLLNNGTSTIATGSQIRILYNGDILNGYGVFTYTGSRSGIIRSFDYYSSGQKVIQVSGLNLNIFSSTINDKFYLRGNDTFYGSNQNDVLVGYGGNDTLQGNAGADVIYGSSGNDVLSGGLGRNILNGGSGNDTATYSSVKRSVTANLSLTGFQTTYLGTADKFTEIENLIGSAYQDNLTGNNRDNTLIGGAANDILNGGLGNDTLDGGLGSDFASYIDSTGRVQVNLGSNLFQNTISSGRDQLISIENVIGSDYNDRLTGNNLSNTLKGGLGNDWLRGGLGNDRLFGGDGIDTADYGNAKKTVRIDLSTTANQNTGSEGFDRLISIENLNGSHHADILKGNSLNNRLLGRNGNDLLIGQDGNDWLRGGLGNDRLFGGDGIDTADYGSSKNSVRVDLNITINQNTFGEGFDRLVNIENLNGSNYADTLKGNALNNRLLGRSGNDFLIGNAGDDWLQGGLGNDNLFGGSGNDTVDYGSAKNSISVDLNITTSQNTLAEGVDRLVSIENLNGSNHDDTLIGNEQSNTLAGRSGNDLLQGNDGDDILNGGQGNDLLIGGGGSDTASFESASSAVDVDLKILGFQDTGSEGIDFFDSIENLTGSSYDDRLIGDSFGNTIRGGEGNDAIIGWLGSDVLFGGLGDDILNGWDGNDTVSYADISGSVEVDLRIDSTYQDTVSAGSDWIISVQNVIGSEYNDRLQGSAVANQLTGAAGDDVLYGHEGDDVFFNLHGDGNDQFFGGEGIDTSDYSALSQAISVDLANTSVQTLTSAGNDILNGIENLTGTEYNDTFFGNSIANTLTGGNGDDSLFGRDGDDTLIGGLGNDLLDGGDGSDTISLREASATVNVDLNLTTAQDLGVLGQDTLVSIENVLGARTEVNNLIGNAADNYFSGGYRDDTFIGGHGDDTFLSFGGNNIFNGGEGSDTVDFSYVSTSSNPASLTIDLNIITPIFFNNTYSTLISIENIIGNEHFNNFLTGNSENNKLEGGRNNDVLYGGYGDDILIGLAEDLDGTHRDRLYGEAGNDILFASHSTATGGADSDTFILQEGLANIVDFSSLEGDLLQLDETLYGNLSETNDVLDSSSFSSSTVLDFNDILSGPTILYESSTGDIYYDADGGTGFDAIHIASVMDGLLLSNTDFSVA